MTVPAILFDDVEAAFITDMRAVLAARPEPYAASVAVRNRVPDESDTDSWPASGRLVVVRDDGGPTTWVRGIARIGVRVWAPLEGEASDLANLLVALVGGWESNVVRDANPSRPFSVTEESGRPAMYFTAELTIRGRKLPAA